MATNKDEQYTAIYFKQEQLADKQEAYFSMLDIDCNWSKLIQVLLADIIRICKEIKAKGKNFRHYNFKLVAEEKAPLGMPAKKGKGK